MSTAVMKPAGRVGNWRGNPYAPLKLPIVCEPDERFEGDDADEGCVDQVIGEPAGCEVVAQLPAVTAEYEECSHSVACRDRIGQAHDLERHAPSVPRCRRSVAT